MSLRSIVSGTAAMSSVRLLRLVAQFVAIPILSRLLSPEEYGLVALAMPFTLFAMMLADAGMSMSLVRTPANEHVQWSSGFWLMVGFGAALAVIMALLGPIASYVFGEPALSSMLVALGFVVLAQAVHVVPISALQQASRFKTIAGIEIAATAAGISTAVIMAYDGYGAWALIGQQIAFFAVRVTLACWLSPFRPARVFNWQQVKPHIIFGRNVLGNSMTQFFARSFDNWVVGRALGASLLGYYSMAFQFARLPSMLVTAPLQYVMYADLARQKDDISAIGRHYLTTTRLLATLVLPAVGMVAAAHQPIFTLILSERWSYAGVIFMILAPACAMQAVAAVGETVLYAIGQTARQMRCTLEYTILWILSLLVASQFSLASAAVAFTICTLLYQWRYQHVIGCILGIALRQYGHAIRMPIMCTVAGIALYGLIDGSATLGMWGKLALCLGLFASALAASVAIQWQTLKAELAYYTANRKKPTGEASDTNAVL